MTIDDLLDNPGVERTSPYAAIIGRSPSQGARSPLLWNAAFAAMGRPARMVPFDVSPDRAIDLLTALDADERFLGGAVAVPYKKVVSEWLEGRQTAGARRAGAVNCLFRGDDGRLAGANTDGEAAVRSIERGGGRIAGARWLVLGGGGTARAIVAEVAARPEPPRQVVIAARSPERVGPVADIGAQVAPWTEVPRHAADADVVVNATPVGSVAARMAGASPVDGAVIDQLRPDVFVYDVVYDPSPTALVRAAREVGRRASDGLEMNLDQAVLAFARAVGGEQEVIRRAMDTAAAHV